MWVSELKITDGHEQIKESLWTKKKILHVQLQQSFPLDL